MLAAVLALLGAVSAVLFAPTALLKLLPSVTERLPGLMRGRLPRFIRRLLRKAQRIVITVARQTRRGHALRRALVLSVPFYFTIFVAQYCVLHAVGAQVRLSDVILVGGLVPLLSLVPISLNGIGLAEGVFVAVYGVVGVLPDAALAAALLRRLVDLLNSALGGLLWLMERRFPDAIDEQRPARRLRHFLVVAERWLGLLHRIEATPCRLASADGLAAGWWTSRISWRSRWPEQFGKCPPCMTRTGSSRRRCRLRA